MRRTAVVAALLAALLGVAGPAVASALARAGASATTSSASFGAAGGPSAGPAGSGDYVVSFTVLSPVQPQYFRVFNTGTLALTGQTYTAVNSKPSGSAPPTIALDACVGATWDAVLGTCGGTVVRLTSSDLGATAATLALPVGGSASVRAAATKLANFPQAFTTTVTVGVSRSQAAAGAVRTS